MNALSKDYDIHKVYGWLELYGSENNPPEDPEEPYTPDTPVGSVLGAKREAAGEGGAVLGARRAGTEDTTNNIGRIITIVVAAGIGFTMIFLKRKKNEDQ